MADKETGKEVAKPEKGRAVTGYDYGDQAGAGFEDTKGSDLSVPFIAILQALSPQVENNDPEGSKSGMLFNTVTRELTEGDKGVVFQPCHKERAFVEWKPDRGGFVGMHEPEGEIVKAAIEANDGSPFGGLKVGDNDLMDTYYVYGLILNEEGTDTLGFAVISFTSTKIKPYRDWITAMYTQKGKPPIFANRARIRTIKQKNDHGTFYNYRIDPLRGNWAESLVNPAEERDLLVGATEFVEMVKGGIARADFDTERATGGGGSADAGDGEDPPF